MQEFGDFLGKSLKFLKFQFFGQFKLQVYSMLCKMKNRETHNKKTFCKELQFALKPGFKNLWKYFFSGIHFQTFC